VTRENALQAFPVMFASSLLTLKFHWPMHGVRLVATFSEVDGDRRKAPMVVGVLSIRFDWTISIESPEKNRPAQADRHELLV
jgi:hypothetical protein